MNEFAYELNNYVYIPFIQNRHHDWLYRQDLLSAAKLSGIFTSLKEGNNILAILKKCWQ